MFDLEEFLIYYTEGSTQRMRSTESKPPKAFVELKKILMKHNVVNPPEDMDTLLTLWAILEGLKE